MQGLQTSRALKMGRANFILPDTSRQSFCDKDIYGGMVSGDPSNFIEC